MLKFHAQRLQAFRTVPGPKRADGEPTADRVVMVADLSCQIIPGSQSKMVYSDGESVHYTFHVYLPKDCPTLKVGTVVRLYGTDGEEIKSSQGFKVLQFFRYQLSAQVWV